jgi:hypothetical protein
VHRELLTFSRYRPEKLLNILLYVGENHNRITGSEIVSSTKVEELCPKWTHIYLDLHSHFHSVALFTSFHSMVHKNELSLPEVVVKEGT